MHRFVARVLLTVFFAGVFASAAPAMSPEPPHACCLRKAPHCHSADPGHETTIEARCDHHSCCRSLTVSVWAFRTPRAYTVEASTADNWQPLVLSTYSIGVSKSHLVRGPPSSFVS